MASDPGRLHLACITADRLIRFAYLRDASGKHLDDPTTFSRRIENQDIAGEPGWAQSDRYTVDAKPETPQVLEMMRGPMLQSLLEERFKLRLHRDGKEMPVYALVVGKGESKLTAAKVGGCRPIEQFDPSIPLKPGDLPICGFFSDDNGRVVTLSQTLGGLCAQFSVALDRDVVDRTGLAGKFDIRLDLSSQDLFPWESTPQTAGAAAALPFPDATSAIMAAVQKLGLRLEPAIVPAEHLVIDHIEKPSEN